MKHYALTQQLLLAGMLALTSGMTVAAGRDGRDFVVDSKRTPPRTGLLGQCIRTGMSDAGAPARDCSGKQAEAPAAPAVETRAPEPAPAPEAVTEAPPAMPDTLHYENPEIVPVEPPAPLHAEEAPEHKPKRTVEKAPPPTALPPMPEPASATSAPPTTPARDLPVAPPPTTPVNPRKHAAHVTLNAATDFDFGKATLRPSGKVKLDQFTSDLKSVTFTGLKVTGHTDRIGKRAYNMKLSQRRADAVKSYLVSKYLRPEVIETLGVGPDRPVTKPTDCVDLKLKALIGCLQPDRRVEIEVRGAATPAQN